MQINIELKIPKNAKVLEIGAGGFPHPKSSLIVDKYLGDVGVRQRGGSAQVIDRPFIQADGCCLPFPDKLFDYVIASHVIEHIPEKDLLKFTDEIMRVGRAGYIEAPGPLYETLRDIPEHIFFVICQNNTIHLYLKQKKDIPFQQKLIDPMFYDPDFRPIFTRYADIWHTGMEWEGRFDIIFHKSLNELWDLYNEEEILQKIRRRIDNRKMVKNQKAMTLLINDYIQKTFVWRLMKRLKKLGGEGFNTGHKQIESSYYRIDWHDIVVCPMCHSKLNIDLSLKTIECFACEKKYSYKGDIPSFLP